MNNNNTNTMEEQEIQFSKAYNILSQAGFELLVEDGQLSVFMKGCDIDFDDEGLITILPFK